MCEFWLQTMRYVYEREGYKVKLIFLPFDNVSLFTSLHQYLVVLPTHAINDSQVFIYCFSYRWMSNIGKIKCQPFPSRKGAFVLLEAAILVVPFWQINNLRSGLSANVAERSNKMSANEYSLNITNDSLEISVVNKCYPMYINQNWV